MWQYRPTEELYHYGVPGMKWGHRKQPIQGTGIPISRQASRIEQKAYRKQLKTDVKEEAKLMLQKRVARRKYNKAKTIRGRDKFMALYQELEKIEANKLSSIQKEKGTEYALRVIDGAAAFNKRKQKRSRNALLAGAALASSIELKR